MRAPRHIHFLPNHSRRPSEFSAASSNVSISCDQLEIALTLVKTWKEAKAQISNNIQREGRTERTHNLGNKGCEMVASQRVVQEERRTRLTLEMEYSFASESQSMLVERSPVHHVRLELLIHSFHQSPSQSLFSPSRQRCSESTGVSNY